MLHQKINQIIYVMIHAHLSELLHKESNALKIKYHVQTLSQRNSNNNLIQYVINVFKAAHKHLKAYILKIISVYIHVDKIMKLKNQLYGEKLMMIKSVMIKIAHPVHIMTK